MGKNAEAIAVMEGRLADLERKGNTIVDAINDMLAEDGLPPRGPFGGGSGGGAGAGKSRSTQIKPDTFYGRKLQTAVREYLEMRFAAAGGRTDPATPREIYDAITTGGYQFDAKTADIAMVGLRALLRKRTAFFHKLPNGTYGLTSWYPDAKKPKHAAEDDADADAETDDDGDASEQETATPKGVAA
jgi:hypothetical protein